MIVSLVTHTFLNSVSKTPAFVTEQSLFWQFTIPKKVSRASTIPTLSLQRLVATYSCKVAVNIAVKRGAGHVLDRPNLVLENNYFG